MTWTRHTLLTLLSLALATEAFPVPEATATIVVPMSDRDLTESAVAVVIGDVTAIESHWNPTDQQISTYVTLDVVEVLRGDVGTGPVTLRQMGGRVGNVDAWVDGSPEFAVGERVLLFLRTNPDGTLRVAHLHQGRFSVLSDAYSGQAYAHRPAAPRGVHVLGAPGTTPTDAVHELETFKRRIRGFARQRAPLAARGSVTTAAAPPPGGVTEVQAAFTFLGAARWFEPDSGAPVTMFLNSQGEPTAPTRGFDQIRAALAAWSGVSSFRFADGGFTAAQGYHGDGVSAVSFGDPLGQMDPPVGCSGTLGIGGYFASGETRTVNGIVFNRIVEGDVVGNSGWEGCSVNTDFDKMAEWLTHELGHILGLGHSTSPDATMYAIAHFDGRGASLRADDIAGLRALYPGGSTPPPASATLSISRVGSGTVRSTGITCGTDCTETYPGGTTVTVTATPAAGWLFGGWSGGGCGTGGTCTLVMNASTSVTATFVVAKPDLVDIAVSDPPATVRLGGTFTVTDTVHNQGPVAAGSSTTRYFLSADTVKNTGDRALNGSRSVPALGAGATSTGTVSVKVPWATSPGTYYVLACPDAPKLVPESNEKNNCRPAAARVQVTP